jgi:hypothetical protein
MVNGDLTSYVKTVLVSTPKDQTGAAATTEWICMKYYQKVRFVIATGAWAGGTSVVTVIQATSDGGSSKAVSFSWMYTNDGATTTDTLTKTAVSSNTFSLDTASSLYIVEIDASMLDVSNSYDWVAIQAASPSSNSDFTCIIAECYSAGIKRGTSSPSAIA